MTIILLSISIILLTCFMLYLARRKDFQLLKFPPFTFTLPRTKYEQALKELNAFKKQPLPKSRRQQLEHNSEQFYLERRLNQIQQDTDLEQKSYYLACKEKEIAWKDYHDFFESLTLIEKLIAPGKIRELQQLRNLYLEAEKKVDLELNKFNARTRIRRHEERVKQQRDEEIDRKTQSEAVSDDSIEKKVAPEADSIRQAFEEIKLSNDSSSSLETDSEMTEQPPINSAEENRRKKDKTGAPISNQFGQAEFPERYPDFNGLTYIDETLSLIELNLSIIQDANFDRSFFISVLFKDRHQFKDCSFREADLSYSLWQRSSAPHRILSCDFTGAKLKSAHFEFMAFYNCIFTHADFEGAQFYMVKFVNCNFVNCTIANVDFSQTVMSADMLESIDFSSCINPPKNANFKNEPYQQSDESDSILPSSDESS